MSMPIMDSGVPWIGEIPAHWFVTKPKFGCSRIVDGTHHTPDYVDEGIPFITVKNLTAGPGISFEDTKFISESDHASLIRRAHPQRGDLLITKDGTLGVTRVVETDRPFSIFVSVALLKVRGHILNPWFLKYAFDSDALWLQFEARKTGSGLKHLIIQDIGNVIVPLPSPTTQKAIANYLDRKTAAIDALIEKKQKLLDLLAEKRAALINQAVTKGLDPDVPMKDSGVPWIGEIPAHWEVMQLRRQLTLQRGVDITKDEQREGPVPVVSSGGVASYHDTALVGGPGVVVGRKGSVGTVHWVEQDYWPHDTTLYVRWFGANLPRFIYYKLLAMKLETFDTGSANPTVNRNIVHPVHVSWPPKDEQRRIVQALDSTLGQMRHIDTNTTRSIERLREYRQALITAAVTGQLDIEEDAA